MDFEFSDEQNMLRDSLASYLSAHYDFEARRAAAKVLPGWRPDIWTGFARRLGLLGATFAEESGGLGGGPIENLVIMEELGKCLSLEPWLETIIMARPLLERGGAEAERLLSAVIAGTAIVIPVLPQRSGTGARSLRIVNGKLTGSANAVRQGAIATHFVVAALADDGALRLHIVPAEAAGIIRRDQRGVDSGWISDIDFEGVALSDTSRIAGADAAERVEAAFDAGTAGLCAEALGIQRRLLDLTVAYAKERKQFGRAIGAFQVLQHRMADMFMRVEESVSMTYMAAMRLDQAPRQRAAAVAMAKLAVDEAARFVGQSAIQIHGGMGMTKELPVADYVARLTVIAFQLGSRGAQLRRYSANRLAA